MRLGSRESSWRKDLERYYGWVKPSEVNDKSKLRTRVYSEAEVIQFSALRALGWV